MTTTPPPFWASANEKAAYNKEQLEAGNARMNELAATITIKPSINTRPDRFVNSNFSMGL